MAAPASFFELQWGSLVDWATTPEKGEEGFYTSDCSSYGDPDTPIPGYQVYMNPGYGTPSNILVSKQG